MNDIRNKILKYKYPLESEKELQELLFEFVLEKEGYLREYRLSSQDIVDFYQPELKIAIEVKIKGGSSEIYRQIQRYCRHESVKQVILVSSKAMGLPDEIEGKECSVLTLGKVWL